MARGVRDEHHSIEAYQGLARPSTVLGAALRGAAAQPTGCRLTTGFYAKFAVLASVVDAGGGALALIAVDQVPRSPPSSTLSLGDGAVLRRRTRS